MIKLPLVANFNASPVAPEVIVAPAAIVRLPVAVTFVVCPLLAPVIVKALVSLIVTLPAAPLPLVAKWRRLKSLAVLANVITPPALIAVVPPAVIAPVCVTPPLEFNVRLLLPVASAPLTAISPLAVVNTVGSTKVTAPPTVSAPVLVASPIVTLLKPSLITAPLNKLLGSCKVPAPPLIPIVVAAV